MEKSSVHWFRSSFLDKVLYCTAFSQGQEQMIIGGRKIWVVWWMMSTLEFSSSSFWLVMFCDVGSSFVVKKEGGDVAQPLEWRLTGQTIQLLPMQLCSDDGFRWKQLKQPHALTIPSDWQHEPFRMEPILGWRIWVIHVWPPRLFVLNICLQKPFHISSDNGDEPGLLTPDRRQTNGFLDTGLALGLDHPVGYSLWQPGHEAEGITYSTSVDCDTPKAFASWHVVCCRSSLTRWSRRSSSGPEGQTDQWRSSTSWFRCESALTNPLPCTQRECPCQAFCWCGGLILMLSVQFWIRRA